ncbi:MAG TPA: hypothetical protein VEB66_08755 [Opitutaceae bacterium]|nr:hypothetical protein [Opitutaceae bacterium]
MNDSPFNSAFPHRTPVFTTVLVILCFAAFGWLAYRIYVPGVRPAAKVEGERTPAERKALLVEQQQKERAAAASYGWVDQPAGVVRLPLDRAMALTAKEHAKP